MEEIRQHIAALNTLTGQMMEDPGLLDEIRKVCDLVTGAFRNGNRVFFCGNGGSAADAQHLAAELSGKLNIDRPMLPAEALHVNPSYITAVANDYSFEDIYSRYITGIAQKGDILFGLSTSGRSANVVRAFIAAKSQEVVTIGFTGETGGTLKSYADHLINIPSTHVPRIQEMHLLIGHIICEKVEKELFGKGKNTGIRK